MAEKNAPQVTVGLRRNYSKDGLKSILFSMLMATIVITFLILLLAYIVSHPPEPAYFATSVSGRITPIISLNEPNQSDSAVLQWANQAAIASYTYNFVNYSEELKAASIYYTSKGWQQFMTALEQSNNLATVQSKKLIVSAVATRAPIILEKGMLSGRYSWRVQMPVLVTYQSASEFTQQNIVVTMLITRISTIESPRGIGIAQIIVGPASGGIT